eukprot:3836205-Prymnesium_polylepis.1
MGAPTGVVDSLKRFPHTPVTMAAGGAQQRRGKLSESQVFRTDGCSHDSACLGRDKTKPRAGRNRNLSPTNTSCCEQVLRNVQYVRYSRTYLSAREVAARGCTYYMYS